MFSSSCRFACRRASRQAESPRAARPVLDALERRILFAAGDLDTSFGGGDGIVAATIGSTYDSVLQPDGKLVVVGLSGGTGSRTATVARFNTDGSLDRSFGGGDGVTNVLVPGLDNSLFSEVALLPDGKILAAGDGVARFNPDGSLDRSFGGGDGFYYVPVGGPNGMSVNGMAARPDGKILLSTFHNPGPGDWVRRLNADGTLDTSFGQSGFVLLPEPDGDPFIHPNDLDLAPNGKIVASGGGGVWRLKADGSLDATFGGGDGVTVAPGDLSSHNAVLQPDGKIVLAGSVANDSFDGGWAVARLNSDGSPDRTFGLDGDGVARTPFNDLFPSGRAGATPFDLALQPDGKIVATGHVNGGFSSLDSLVAVVRYHADGTPDTSFSGDGRVINEVPGVFREGGESIVVDRRGRILVNGHGDTAPFGLSAVTVLLAYQGAAPGDGISFTGGDTLTIEGTSGNDAISVTRSGSLVFARRNAAVRSFDASRVRRLFVVGNAGNDTITIGSGVVGADLYGGSGNDRLVGGAGDDVLEGGTGADDLSGGGGIDTADYFRRTDDLRIDFDGVADDGAAGEGDNVRGDMENVTGGHGDDEITGNSKNNRLIGGRGDDRLVGLAGDDWLDGGLGADFMSGGQGVDTIDYSSRAGPGVTVTLVDALPNDGAPGEGDNAQADNLIGTAANDHVSGSQSPNVIDGRGGNDVLFGLGGDDTLRGGSGNDRLDGGAGNDLLDGGVADPNFEPNVDTADYSARADDLTIDLNNAANLTPSGERDRYVNIDNVEGGRGNDRIIGDGNANSLSGNAGNDTLIGNDGNDVFDGGAGADAYHGGGGRDTADYTRRTEDLVISLDNAANDGAAGERDDVRGDVEIVNAGSGNDRITGSSAINTFRGGDGNDTLDGGTGDDQLFGGRGDDVLTGGAGTDRLSGEEGNDTLFARDNTADILNGGSGTDRAQKENSDTVTNVETLLA